MKNVMIENRDGPEKILLVMVNFKRHGIHWDVQENFNEMKELITACGGVVVGHMMCPVDKPTAGYLISENKVKNIARLCLPDVVDLVVFSYDLKGSQQRNIEKILQVKTIDRTQLILDIFAKHADSREGKMQVELAQLEYFLPRLVGKGVELSRPGGGIGTLGPGETKLETDRRRIGQRITHLKKHLSDIASQRTLKRKQRKDKGIPSLSLVGYTNAGKSTLINALTLAEQETRDGLFTTLDPLSRQLSLPNHQKVIISDTVGFMHDLPIRLIEAFHATLEEVVQADLLLHVVDVSRVNFRDLCVSVEEVLKDLGTLAKPTLLVFNKIDKLQNRQCLEGIEKNSEHAVCISAKTGENIAGLLDKISTMLSSLIVEINVQVPIARMDLVNLAHEEGEVFSVKYYAHTINIRAVVPKRIAGQFKK